MAAADYFLKIEGIKGESTADKHKDEIDVLSFSWGVTQLGARGATGGAGAGKANFQDFKFTMRVNRASPTLFLECASGQHVKQAVMVGEMSSGIESASSSSQFFKYTFTDVIISSYHDGGTGDGVVDAAALNYANVKVEATPGARVGVAPTATGNLMFDPATGSTTVVEGETGVLLAGPVLNTDGILTGLLRGISEFSLDAVLGLISGPSPHMRLVLGVQEVRTITAPPTDANLDAPSELVTTDGSGDEPKKPKKNTLRYNLYWYAPADLALTSDDFDRKGRRLGRIQLDPDGDPLQQGFDLTELVLDGNLDSIGIRIQSALDHGGSDDDDASENVAETTEAADLRATPRRPGAFMLALEVVAD